MKRIFFLIIANFLFQQFGYSQKRVITKYLIPGETSKSLLRISIVKSSACSLALYSLKEPTKRTLLHFNNQPIIRTISTKHNTISFYTELSFNDVLKNSVNNIKDDLINTYDNNLPELFKDAPSLIKLICLIPLKSNPGKTFLRR